MDYFNRSRANSRTITTPDNASVSSEVPPTPPPIRLRRLPSTALYDQALLQRIEEHGDSNEAANRRRSMSLPEQRRPDNIGASSSNELRRQATTQQAANAGLTPVREESGPVRLSMDLMAAERPSQTPSTSPPPPPSANASKHTGRRRAATSASSRRPGPSGGINFPSFRSRSPTVAASPSRPPSSQQEYDRDVVDLLDVIDPEISTLTTLNNVQNSLFVPYLGRFLNRTPTYDLTRSPTITEEVTQIEAEKRYDEEQPRPPSVEPSTTSQSLDTERLDEKTKAPDDGTLLRPLSRSHTISSVLKDDKFAVLPHGVSLKGWSSEDIDELDDHVRHMLHSRRSGFKRSMKGFWRYFRTPIGFFVTTYAFLITFWGAAWVIFLIGWINVGNRREYFIEICDQILTAMLCVFGIGLAPFRVVDTYHMGFIAYYHRLTWKLRKQKDLPELFDPNDLPQVDPEMAALESDPDAVLDEKQLNRLYHHQAKFARSHTYYRPHETYTHRAFPLWCLITVVALLDAHSCFQIALGGTTWGIYYKKRGHVLTTVILACSLTCNITGGIMISIGDKLTRKKEIKEQMYRQTLTAEAIEKMKKKKGWEVPQQTTLEKSSKRHWWSLRKKRPASYPPEVASEMVAGRS